MARRDHDETMVGLKENIQWREENKGSRGTKYTASYFPADWFFHSTVYKSYCWGIFYRHRFYGFTLTKHYRDVLAQLEKMGRIWHDWQEYADWRLIFEAKKIKGVLCPECDCPDFFTTDREPMKNGNTWENRVCQRCEHHWAVEIEGHIE